MDDKLLEHEYDGIREYDNRLPNWWLYTLYGSIVFAIGYWIVFETLEALPGPHGRYVEEMAAAAELQLANMGDEELTNESILLMAAVPDRVTSGESLFQQFCVVCHGNQGQGNVGPNLTDGFWLHGNEPLQIHDTVENGVLDKGMAAWGPQLGPRRVQDVVAYVLTIIDTNIPGKAPEGVEVSKAGIDG